MKLTDLLCLEKWKALEEEIAQRFNIDANVFDTNGIRITDFKNWANSLCPEIKATDKGQSYICAVAHMNVAAQTKRAQTAFIEECDAGLMKLVVPIFVGGEFIGAFGVCGVMLEDSEADAFLINKITDIDEDRIASLSKDVAQISHASAEEIKDHITERISAIVRDFESLL